MRGLIYKDLYNLSKYMKQLLLILIAMTALFAMQGSDGIGFLSAYTVMLSMMVVVSSMSYDEFAKWDRYALTMPITRTRLVGSKYLLGLLMGAVGSLISLVFLLVSGFLSKKPVGGEDLVGIGGCFFACLLLLGVLLPLLYKFGVEKSRMLFIAVAFVPTIAVLALTRLGIPAPSGAVLKTLLLIAPFVALALFAGSFFLSVSIVKKKEF